MANHRPPDFLFRNNAAWRAWLEEFPRFEAGGYVPAGRYLTEVRAYLFSHATPATRLKYEEAEGLRQWFMQQMQPGRRSARDNKGKNLIGYLATAIPIIADLAITGGIATTVATISGLLGVTTFGFDLANGKLVARLDEVEDLFDGWLDSKR